jgi:hypothetical protein
MAGSGEVDPLPFLGVGRLESPSGDTLLATYHTPNSDKKEEIEGVFKKFLKAARVKLEPGQRIRLLWQEGSVCCLKDMGGTLVFCLVTVTKTYSETRAFDLLTEFAGSVAKCSDYETCAQDGLKVQLAPVMKALLEKYSRDDVPVSSGRPGVSSQAPQTCAERCSNSCAVM